MLKTLLKLLLINAQLSDFAYNAASIGTSTTVVEAQRGQNSLLKLNGLEVSRESNNITDVIKGLDFTINKADIGKPISFSITEDKSSAEAAIRGFVTAYNLFYETAANLTGVSTDENNQVVTGDFGQRWHRQECTGKSAASIVRYSAGLIGVR